ncbi:hypothetical protein N431DRAFT_338728 [Stipitochalara longipes BDJ]|nr:hypothetical protein N431DRAFT_338728 [Stipitochalara longipes BDJ]
MNVQEEVPDEDIIELDVNEEREIIPLSTTRLTWGVELEFVFAFHKTQLELAPITIGSIVHETKIKKDISYVERGKHTDRNTDGKIVLGNSYNSWLLENQGRGNKVVVYDGEVERILHRVLQEKCEGINTRVERSLPIDQKTSALYDQWLIMGEKSICGVGSKNIPTWLPQTNSTTEWDSYGLELVSPVFDTESSNQGYTEIAQILDATRGLGKLRNSVSTWQTGAFITNQCGLHVHVQAPRDMEVLQELAFLIFVYEGEISRLHPRCRHPMHPNAQYIVESNRLSFRHENKRSVHKYTYGEYDVSDAELASAIAGTFKSMRDEIDQCEDPEALALLMNWPADGIGNDLGNRNRQVNFTAAARLDDAPYTIEFRQARGSLNPTVIQKWVEFCIGLVRLAQFYDDNPGKFPMKTFKPYELNPNKKVPKGRFYIMDLMEDMGLSKEDKAFWKDRIAMFEGGEGGPRKQHTSLSSNLSPPFH